MYYMHDYICMYAHLKGKHVFYVGQSILVVSLALGGGGAGQNCLGYNT